MGIGDARKLWAFADKIIWFVCNFYQLNRFGEMCLIALTHHHPARGSFITGLEVGTAVPENPGVFVVGGGDGWWRRGWR